MRHLLLLYYVLGGVLSDPDSVSVPFPDGKAPDGTRYKKDYRCESEQLTIGCKVHERIRVIRANYGRFSLAICNKHGSTELSVNCMSPQTTGILKAKCDNLSNCTMQVNSHVFGEPCPGVQKYLEVHYACVTQSGLHSGTTPRLPSWLLEGAAGNLWTDSKDTYFEEMDEDPDELEYEDDFEDLDGDIGGEDEDSDGIRRKPILVQATTPVRIPITTPKPTTTSSTTISHFSTSESSQEEVRVNELAHVNQLEIVSSVNQGHDADLYAAGCPPSQARFLFWNRTSPGEISIQPCPEGTSGLARWVCGHDEIRETPHPDMSDCKSHSMSELEASVRNEEPESVIASRLSILTGKTFFGGDLETSVSVIKSISNRLQYLIRHKENFYNKASFVSDVFQNIFRSASNLLNNAAVWKDVSETSRRSKIASDMVSVLEDCAFLWADSLEEPEIVYESTNNAVMAISSTLESHQTFPSTPNTPEWFGNSDSISLSLPGAAKKELSKMVFFSYKDLHRLLPPKKLEADLASRVISADVQRPGVREKNAQLGLSILFHHNRSSSGGSPPLSCGRWDEEIGDWSLEPCYLAQREESFVKCTCSSPGMFALLAAKESANGGFPHEQSINASSGGFSDLISLEIATYIVSIICFLIIVLIIVQFRKQIRKLFKKSGCCCCICSERESGDKSRDLYTGATLMEAASSGANASTTTASSSSGSSSSTTTLPSRMVTSLSPESNRVGILHYNNPTLSQQPHPHHHHHQYSEALSVSGGSPISPLFHQNNSIRGVSHHQQQQIQHHGGLHQHPHHNHLPLNNNLPPLHAQPQPPPPPPQKLNNPLYPNRREEKEYKYPSIVSDEREYAYHSESSSSGVSGSSSSSRLQRRSPGDSLHAVQQPGQVGRVFPPYREAPLYHGQPRHGLPSEGR